MAIVVTGSAWPRWFYIPHASSRVNKKRRAGRAQIVRPHVDIQLFDRGDPRVPHKVAISTEFPIPVAKDECISISRQLFTPSRKLGAERPGQGNDSGDAGLRLADNQMAF